MTRAPLLAFALAACAALAACTGPPDGPDAGPSDAGPTSLTLGTGAHAFTPIAENDTLLLAHGCQGLQHVWISLRASGIANRGVHVRLTMTRASDGTDVAAVFDTAITFTPDPSGAFAELSGLMLVIPTPELGLGLPLVLRGEITDRDGRTTASQLDVSLGWGSEICGA